MLSFVTNCGNMVLLMLNIDSFDEFLCKFLVNEKSSKKFFCENCRRESGQTLSFDPLSFHGFHPDYSDNGLDFTHCFLATQNPGNVRL